MNAKEIRRLRKKFILIAMVSIFLAMLFIGAMINLVSFHATQREIRWTLNYIIENRGELQGDESSIIELFQNPSLPEVFAPSYRSSSFYIFIYDQDGTMLETKSDKDNWNSIDEIERYADTALERKVNYGRYGMYYYQKKEIEKSQTILVFLDCGILVTSQARLLYASIAVALLGMIITFFLVRALSAKMIRPEIENSRRQNQFITNASHELKTPLAVIRANTEMIELLSGESEWTQSTIRQVDSLNGLIQNLVMISKSREQEDTSERTRIDVSKYVKESVEPFRALIRQDGKKLELAAGEGITLIADGSKIRQLTTVLVDNAIKYCDENGTIRVELETIKRGRGIQLTVSNSYQAGETVDCNQFFDRFYREDQSHNIDKGGYGIGLSIAESICEQHGGSIRARWKNGEISFVCQLMELF